jgi:hypothetical protein
MPFEQGRGRGLAQGRKVLFGGVDLGVEVQDAVGVPQAATQPWAYSGLAVRSRVRSIWTMK